MKLVFFGTPLFAAKVLEYLLEHQVSILALVTQPDRPCGRKLVPTPSAAKMLIQTRQSKIPILQPEKASDPAFLQCLEELQADLYVVVAYGQILSRKLLALPPLGCINVHASLLPKYRGAAPMQRALMDGVKETGISIQKMVFQLDAGDVIDEARVPVGPDETLGDLEEKLCELAKPLLLSILKRYELGIPSGTPQESSLVSFAPKIEREEMLLDWKLPASILHNRVRAVSPRPGAWCWVEIGGERKRLKVLRSSVKERTGSPGEVLLFQQGECLIGTGQGALQLIEVQIEGKRAMEVSDWMRGCPLQPFFPLSD